MQKLRNLALDVATITAAGAAVVAAVSLVAARNANPVPLLGQNEERFVEDWKTIADEGHRSGPPTASVTVVEFGDYECAACRKFQATMESVLERYPSEVAFVYRHWPLQQHLYAYDAARAAECAAIQGRFWEYHLKLYAEPRWIDGAFLRFAEHADVKDLSAFAECIRSTGTHEKIDSDIAAAKRLGGGGTPTVIVNGVLQPRPPSAMELEEAVLSARR